MLVKKNLCKASIIKSLCAIYYCNNSTEIVITSCWFVWDWPVTEFTFLIFIYDALLNLHSVFCSTLLLLFHECLFHGQRTMPLLSFRLLLKATSCPNPSPTPLPRCWAATSRGSALLAPLPICAAENQSGSCKLPPSLLRFVTSWHPLP